jgi:hypothetical protein
MHPQIRVDVPRFWGQGYLIIRNVFSRAEVAEFRRRAFEDRHRKGDLLCRPHLRKALLDDRVLDIAAQILGDTPVYYGDSTCNLGQPVYEFHKDNPDRSDANAPDWKGRYTQIRFGLYLQDQTRHSGGLRIIPGSHNVVPKPPTLPGGRRVNVRTRVGDLVVWNLRTHHTGAAPLLRLLPWVYVETPGAWVWGNRYLIPIDRPIRMRLPRFLFAGDGPERAALFFTFGCKDAHLERNVAYLKSRAYAIENWKNSEYGPDVWEAVRGKTIKVIDIGAEVRRRLDAGDQTLGVNKGHTPIPY